MKITVSLVLLVIAVISFAVGAVRPGLGGVSWTDAGLAFTVASFVVA